MSQCLFYWLTFFPTHPLQSFVFFLSFDLSFLAHVIISNILSLSPNGFNINIDNHSINVATYLHFFQYSPSIISAHHYPTTNFNDIISVIAIPFTNCDRCYLSLIYKTGSPLIFVIYSYTLGILIMSLQQVNHLSSLVPALLKLNRFVWRSSTMYTASFQSLENKAEVGPPGPWNYLYFCLFHAAAYNHSVF